MSRALVYISVISLITEGRVGLRRRVLWLRSGFEPRGEAFSGALRAYLLAAVNFIVEIGLYSWVQQLQRWGRLKASKL